MKLKAYNKANCAGVHSGAASIRINKRVGLISLSKEASDRIGIKPGCRIELLQDEDRKEDWYVTTDLGGDGFPVRGKENNGVSFNSTSLAKAMLNSLNWDDPGATIMVGAEPVKHDGMELWPLITKSIRA